jgi:chitin disaccharide deacetylase
LPNVILCADDYAISQGVSEGILKLAGLGRISATSCMAASPHWPEHAKSLVPYAEKIDVGIHLTLSDQTPLGTLPNVAPENKLPSFGALLNRSITKRLDLDEIKREINLQISSFVESFGRPPAFVDGHQHVHQLPGIRDVVVDAILENFKSDFPYLRICSAPLGVLVRRRVDTARAIGIGGFGESLRRLAKSKGIPRSEVFSGVYNFSAGDAYGELFKRFLIGLGDRSLIMCHPGLVDEELKQIDGLTDQREHELRYFLSERFNRTLEKADVKLCRYDSC